MRYVIPGFVVCSNLGSKPFQAETFTVSLSSLKVTSSAGNSTLLSPQRFPMHVLLDSGNPTCLFPKDILKPVLERLPIQRIRGPYFINCNVSLPKMILDFAFGGKEGPLIYVLLDELLSPGAELDRAKERLDKSKIPDCIFGKPLWFFSIPHVFLAMTRSFSCADPSHTVHRDVSPVALQ